MSEFEVVRRTVIEADVATLHHLINDFHEWAAWSPWEDVDPSMDRTYSGSGSGVGARYNWSGNRKAGSGSMEIIESEPARIAIALEFLKPIKASNVLVFGLTPVDHGTEVSWTMTGKQTGLAALFGKVISMDKLVGKDFEKGLDRLRAAAT